MKKLILTAVAVVASVNLYAQGTVGFANGASGLVMNNFVSPARAVNAADGIRVALYWAPLSDPNNFAQIGAAVAVGTPVVGRFNGGTRTTGTATAEGSQAWFWVKAWELAYGATYEAAVAAPAQGGRLALRGESNKFQSGTGAPSATPPLAQVDLAPNIQSFGVNVPEPSVIALGLLGAGSLLLLRRRK